jgi:hypothetical protein
MGSAPPSDERFEDGSHLPLIPDKSTSPLIADAFIGLA